MRAIVASLLYKKKTERAHYTPEEVKRSSSTRSRDGSRRSSPPTDFSSERLRVAPHATRGADGDRARVRIDAPPTPLSAGSFGDAFHRARGVGRPSRRRRGGSRRSLRRRVYPPISRVATRLELSRGDRGPRDGDDEAREAGVRGELTRGACGGETAKVRVWTSRAIHVTVGPRASVLEDVPDEVEGGEGHGGEREDRGSASLPTGASSGAGFPVDHLGDVGEDGEGDGEGYGVGELLGGFRGGDAHETREQQGPTSGTHEGGNAERDGEDGGPNLGGGAGNGGSAAGTPTRDPLSSDSNPQVTQSSTSAASPRRVSRRALILFRLVRLAPPETPWGRRLEAEIGAASSRRSTRRPPDARTPSPRPSSDPKREGGTEARVGISARRDARAARGAGQANSGSALDFFQGRRPSPPGNASWTRLLLKPRPGALLSARGRTAEHPRLRHGGSQRASAP